MTEGRTRHILSLSGGKDSTALAIYLRDRVPDLEYAFCDTEKELPETYEYLDRLEAFLGKPIVRLRHDGRGFDHHLILRNGYLPSPRIRWCTQELKIKPYEAYVGGDPIVSYIGIRADEDREGYISRKRNIVPAYPFKEDGITKPDVFRILESSGLGLPDYYRWRSRSGCYFCFFQQRIEWVGLLENHPDLFEKAKEYERCGDQGFTWVQSESLEELSCTDRIAAIKAEHRLRMAREERRTASRPLVDVLSGSLSYGAFHEAIESWQLERGCTICEI